MIRENTIGISFLKLCGYATAVAIFEYLNIKNTQMCILAILMLIDFIFGIGKQFVLNRKEITSHKAWLGVVKKVSTLILVLSFALMFKGIEIDGTFYINGVLAIFIMAETYSIIQNIYTIRTGKIATEYDVVSKIIKAIGDFIGEMIDKKIDNLKK